MDDTTLAQAHTGFACLTSATQNLHASSYINAVLYHTDTQHPESHHDMTQEQIARLFILVLDSVLVSRHTVLAPHRSTH